MTDRNRERNPGTPEPEPNRNRTGTRDPGARTGARAPFSCKKKASKRWCGRRIAGFLTRTGSSGRMATSHTIDGARTARICRNTCWLQELFPAVSCPRSLGGRSAEGGVEPRPGASFTFWRSGFSEAGPLPLGVLVGFGFQLACTVCLRLLDRQSRSSLSLSCRDYIVSAWGELSASAIEVLKP